MSSFIHVFSKLICVHELNKYVTATDFGLWVIKMSTERKCHYHSLFLLPPQPIPTHAIKKEKENKQKAKTKISNKKNPEKTKQRKMTLFCHLINL